MPNDIKDLSSVKSEDCPLWHCYVEYCKIMSNQPSFNCQPGQQFAYPPPSDKFPSDGEPAAKRQRVERTDASTPPNQPFGDNQDMYRTPLNGHPQMQWPTPDNMMAMYPEGFPHPSQFMMMPPMPNFATFESPDSGCGSSTSSPSTSEESSPEQKISAGPPAGMPWTSNDIKSVMSQKFDEVPGRLCLLSGSTKYKVSLGEMVRRMGTPETLHASLLNGILRKGKGKDAGKILRTSLQAYNIQLATGRRKTAPTTGFTAFCEEEAVLLAKDFSTLCQREGGSEMIGQQITMDAMQSDGIATLKAEMDGLRKGLARIRSLYAALPAQPADIEPRTPAENAINLFSLRTHGFGHKAVQGVIDHLMTVAQESTRMCEGIEMNNHHMMPMSIPPPMVRPPFLPNFYGPQ